MCLFVSVCVRDRVMITCNTCKTWRRTSCTFILMNTNVVVNYLKGENNSVQVHIRQICPSWLMCSANAGCSMVFAWWGGREVKEHCSCHKVQNLTVFLCLSMSSHTNRHSSIPPRATDLELQVIVVAPCDEALYQSSVLLSKNKWTQNY